MFLVQRIACRSLADEGKQCYKYVEVIVCDWFYTLLKYLRHFFVYTTLNSVLMQIHKDLQRLSIILPTPWDFKRRVVVVMGLINMINSCKVNLLVFFVFVLQTIFEIGSTSKSTAQSVMMSKRFVNHLRNHFCCWVLNFPRSCYFCY